MDIIQQVVVCSCSNYIQWYLLLIISIRFLLDMKLKWVFSRGLLFCN